MTADIAAAVKAALLKIDLFLYDGDTNNGGDDALVSEASDDLHRALACDAARPTNLSDPAAAAENSEGCPDCGEPWWAHEYALTGVSGALIDTHGSSDINRWTPIPRPDRVGDHSFACPDTDHAHGWIEPEYIRGARSDGA